MTENNLLDTCIERESASPSESRFVSGRERRVGTFTFGIVLVIAGIAMTAALFFPSLDFRLLLKLSPAVLILLGMEVCAGNAGAGCIFYSLGHGPLSGGIPALVGGALPSEFLRKSFDRPGVLRKGHPAFFSAAFSHFRYSIRQFWQNDCQGLEKVIK